MAAGYRNASFHKTEPTVGTWSASGANMPAYVDLPGLPPSTTTTPDVGGGGYTIAFDYLSLADVAAMTAVGFTFIGGDPAEGRQAP